MTSNPALEAPLTESTEDRFRALETRLVRLERTLDRFIRMFPTVEWPLINNDATDDQIRDTVTFLDEQAEEAAAGRGIAPAEFSRKLFELLPHRADHQTLPGVIATWCYFGDLKPLYTHLRDAGLENVKRSVEEIV